MVDIEPGLKVGLPTVEAIDKIDKFYRSNIFQIQLWLFTIFLLMWSLHKSSCTGVAIIPDYLIGRVTITCKYFYPFLELKYCNTKHKYHMHCHLLIVRRNWDISKLSFNKQIQLNLNWVILNGGCLRSPIPTRNYCRIGEGGGVSTG